MRLLFIIDPLPGLKASKDSSVAMMRAAQARGHEVWVALVDALFWTSRGGVCATATRIELGDDDHAWYRETERTTLSLADSGAVIMRKDPPFDIEYVTATWMLERAEAEGARVFNRPRALRDHSEKFALAEFSAFAPTTLVARDAERLSTFIDEEGDTVLKPLDGMGGRGVFRVRADDPNRNVIIETLSDNGSRSVMAQTYLPAISEGDKRILLIGGEVVPWCLARVPKAGESRGNLAAGGTGIVQALAPRDREIGEALAPIMAERGLLFVGIDVIGDCLTEINVTSPTCMVEIHRETGFDAAALFIAALERECNTLNHRDTEAQRKP
ncbi:MAG: glutathione synthase [Betaproteobacteria bacterium]|uniref:Glutathione synthetase n=1 Tax=Candidatus Proximibacter danicus TaxID=2954365 RepID=A0A9D7K4F8_9PROT|nr:glutathione synthase [Candidatus Proximibacter danicus]